MQRLQYLPITESRLSGKTITNKSFHKQKRTYTLLLHCRNKR